MTAARVDAETRQRVVDLRRSGASLARIADETGLTIAAAAGVVDRYLRELRGDLDPRLEVDRLDHLLTLAWKQAQDGNLAAMDTAIKISVRRDRLRQMVATTRKGTMRREFDKTVRAARLHERLDAGLVATGRRIADHIDAATASGDATEISKALYLTPHLVNVLRQLGATPAARGADPGAVPESITAATSSLAKMRERHRTRAS